MLAISYLEQGNIENFSIYVDKIASRNLYLSKCFLKIIDSVLSKDRVAQTKWEEEYNKITSGPQKDRYDEILVLVRKSQLEEYQWSIEELAIIENIKIDAIKNIITNRNN